LELCVRSIPGVDVAFDGWATLQITKETSRKLSAVGLMHILPKGESPVEIDLSMQGQSIHYQLRFGDQSDQLAAMSESKRWKAMYLYAGGDADPVWVWSEEMSGKFEGK
jgi:hypothetical protein